MSPRTLFKLGALPIMAAAGGHFVAGLIDLVHPTVFVPVDPHARAAMEATHLALTARTSVWSAWLGFQVGFGIGNFLFGALIYAIAAAPRDRLGDTRLFRVIALAGSGVLFAVSLRYWFFAPSCAIGLAFGCFVLASILARSSEADPGIRPRTPPGRSPP